MQVHPAIPEQHAELLSILDAAALQTDSEQTREAIEQGEVFVAVPERQSDSLTRSGSPPVLGTLVLDESKITAIAVRPGRRGQGIGRALVAHAQQSRTQIVAEFDPSVRPFWSAVGFELSEQSETDRLSGVWNA